MNHEYVDDGLLHGDGMKTWSAEKVRKSQDAHGVSVIESRAPAGSGAMVRPSPFARRFTATTPMRMAGPAGHAMMKTAADPGRHRRAWARSTTAPAATRRGAPT